jgi:hypothetical protein
LLLVLKTKKPHPDDPDGAALPGASIMEARVISFLRARGGGHKIEKARGRSLSCGLRCLNQIDTTSCRLLLSTPLAWGVPTLLTHANQDNKIVGREIKRMAATVFCTNNQQCQGRR